MSTSYLVFKALHIVFMVSWFAGLFYSVRLFIYQTEANERDEPERTILVEQFKIMQRRLWWIITTPSMVLTILFGLFMIGANPALLTKFYILVKLGFVGLLVIYHLINHKIFNDLSTNKYHWTSGALRIWNEVATLLLLIIVFIIVMGSAISWIYATLGLFAVALLLLLAIRMYQALRKKEEKHEEN